MKYHPVICDFPAGRSNSGYNAFNSSPGPLRLSAGTLGGIPILLTVPPGLCEPSHAQSGASIPAALPWSSHSIRPVPQTPSRRQAVSCSLQPGKSRCLSMPQPALMQQLWGTLHLIIPLFIMLPFRGDSHPCKDDRGLRILWGSRGAGP